MIRRGLPLLIALCPLAVLAGCGGDDDAPTAAEVQDQIEDALGGTLPGGATIPEDLTDLTDVSLPAGVTVPDLSDVTLPPGVTMPDLSDITLPGGATLPEDLSDISIPDVADDPVGSGDCSVDVTGDVTASWTEQQNMGSALVSPWLSAEQAGVFGDEYTLLFNCIGEGADSLSVFTTTGVTPEQVPQGPGEYQLSSGGLFGAEGDLWGVLVTFEGSDTNWSVAEPGGTLRVTEFDGESITIEIDTPLYDSLAEMAGTPAQSAHLTAALHVTK